MDDCERRGITARIGVESISYTTMSHIRFSSVGKCFHRAISDRHDDMNAKGLYFHAPF